MTNTTFGGALRRIGKDKWQWTDTGEVDARITDLTVGDLVPAFTGHAPSDDHVSVPRYWRRLVRDADAREAISLLCMFCDYSGRGAEYHLIPRLTWEHAMSEVLGAKWEKRYKADILRRAESIRQKEQ